MSSDYLSKIGSSLVRRCETRDPFRIADELGVEVLFCEDFGRLKGMYRVIKRNRFISLSSLFKMGTTMSLRSTRRCLLLTRACWERNSSTNRNLKMRCRYG